MPCTSTSKSVRTVQRTRSDGKTETVTITEIRKVVDGKEEVTRTEVTNTGDSPPTFDDDPFPAIENGKTKPKKGILAKFDSFFHSAKRHSLKKSGKKSGRANSIEDQIEAGDAKAPKDAKSMIAEAVTAHNEYRKKHGANPLKLSESLCAYAQEWAQHLANTGRFRHRSDRKYGENIFQGYSSGGGYSAKTAVDNWYSEIKNYDFKTHGFAGNTGHFTQVVWKGSKEVGIGIANSSDGTLVVVANYDPPGNMLGDFAQNVGAPK